MRNILRREEHPEMNDPQDRLAESMAELLRPMGTLDRIPPAITEEERVLSFRDLPTRELDEIVEAAGKEYEALKAECQQIRNAYIHYTNNVAKQVQRLREGMNSTCPSGTPSPARAAPSSPHASESMNAQSAATKIQTRMPLSSPRPAKDQTVYHPAGGHMNEKRGTFVARRGQ